MIVLHVLVLVALAAAKTADFGLLRGLLLLPQLALAFGRDGMLLWQCGRPGLYVGLVALSYLNLFAAQQRHAELPEWAPALNTVFAVLLPGLLVASVSQPQWLRAAVITAVLALLAGLPTARILFTPEPKYRFPSVADAPLADWRMELRGPYPDEAKRLLRQRPTLRKELCSLLLSKDKYDVRHAREFLRALEMDEPCDER